MSVSAPPDSAPPAPPQAPLSARLDVPSVPLGFFEAIAPRLRSGRGQVRIKAFASGTVGAPRLTAQLFGRGIVATPEDFGVRGDRPSHPELLDYLATAFMDSGWSRKAVLREMVTSPAGTTAAALRHLEERSVKAAFMAAMEAARDRSAELGRG